MVEKEIKTYGDLAQVYTSFLDELNGLMYHKQFDRLEELMQRFIKFNKKYETQLETVKGLLTECQFCAGSIHDMVSIVNYKDKFSHKYFRYKLDAISRIGLEFDKELE